METKGKTENVYINSETFQKTSPASADVTYYTDSDPYYNAVPVIVKPIPVDQLQQYIKEKTADDGFETEFKLLRYGFIAAHDEGRKPENKKRNRFLELFPYDHSRVVLAPDGDAKWDYINASYIKGYKESKLFIAAQGPNPVTVDDFWRMVWQENVSQIVMLTKLMELTKKKCQKYWPDENEQLECGNVTIDSVLVTVRADFTIRKFKVTHGKNSYETRTVTQLHFTSWPDHDVPSAPALVFFWKQHRILHQDQQEDTGPAIVHCSAGIGRTGAFIALDSLYDEAESHPEVNVFKCISKMREARLNMVQTPRQYQFVHEALLEARGSKETFYKSSDFERKFGSESTYKQEDIITIQQEFKSLDLLRPEFKEEQVSKARSEENRKKNRNQKVVPTNKTTLYLSTPVKGRNQYINAVVLPSAVRPQALVASQTPLPDTVVDFWRLVYDHDCFNIVCLDTAQELYPTKNTSLESGPFRVTLSQEDSSHDGFTLSQLTLAVTGEMDSTRQVMVYKPTFNLMSNTGMFLELVTAIDTKGSHKDDKILVHCPDGAKLCGLFCSVLNIITRLRLDKEVDIFLTIRELQCIRPQFIDSFEQYKYCFDMVNEYQRSTNVYANL